MRVKFIYIFLFIVVCGICYGQDEVGRKHLLPGRGKNQIGIEANRYSVWYDLSLYYLRTLGENQKLSVKVGGNPGFIVYDWGAFRSRGITAMAGAQYAIYYGERVGLFGGMDIVYAAKVFPVRGYSPHTKTLTSMFAAPHLGLRTMFDTHINLAIGFGLMSHIYESKYSLLDNNSKTYIKDHLKLEYDFKIQLFYEF